jgi:hypothetical protein
VKKAKKMTVKVMYEIVLGILGISGLAALGVVILLLLGIVA